MSVDSQEKIEGAIDEILGSLEGRIKNGCKLWIRVVKSMFTDLKAASKAKDKAIYGQLMQIESAAKQCDSDQAKAIIKKVQKLKGLVAVAVLSLAAFSLNFQGVQTAARTARRDTFRGGSIHMIARKREEDHARFLPLWSSLFNGILKC